MGVVRGYTHEFHNESAAGKIRVRQRYHRYAMTAAGWHAQSEAMGVVHRYPRRYRNNLRPRTPCSVIRYLPTT
jgi:hypothetical protein